MTDTKLTFGEKGELLDMIDLAVAKAQGNLSALLAIRRKIEGTDKELLVRDHGKTVVDREVSPATADTSPSARPRPHRDDIDQELKEAVRDWLADTEEQQATAIEWLAQQDGLTGARFAAIIAEAAVHLEKPSLVDTKRRIMGLTAALAERELKERRRLRRDPKTLTEARDALADLIEGKG